jgi:hypothetical protein
MGRFAFLMVCGFSLLWEMRASACPMISPSVGLSYPTSLGSVTLAQWITTIPNTTHPYLQDHAWVYEFTLNGQQKFITVVPMNPQDCTCKDEGDSWAVTGVSRPGFVSTAAFRIKKDFSQMAVEFQAVVQPKTVPQVEAAPPAQPQLGSFQAKPAAAFTFIDGLEKIEKPKAGHTRRTPLGWSCAMCGATETPERRSGPNKFGVVESGAVCNACGLRWKRLQLEKSKQNEAKNARSSAVTETVKVEEVAESLSTLGSTGKLSIDYILN